MGPLSVVGPARLAALEAGAAAGRCPRRRRQGQRGEFRAENLSSVFVFFADILKLTKTIAVFRKTDVVLSSRDLNLRKSCATNAAKQFKKPAREISQVSGPAPVARFRRIKDVECSGGTKQTHPRRPTI